MDMIQMQIITQMMIIVYWGNIPLSMEDKKSDHVAEYILSFKSYI